MTTCSHCGFTPRRPRWRLVETYPQRVYAAFCEPCAARQSAEFTPEGAIAYATIIVAVHQGRLNVERGVR